MSVKFSIGKAHIWRANVVFLAICCKNIFVYVFSERGHTTIKFAITFSISILFIKSQLSYSLLVTEFGANQTTANQFSTLKFTSEANVNPYSLSLTLTFSTCTMDTNQVIYHDFIRLYRICWTKETTKLFCLSFK